MEKFSCGSDIGSVLIGNKDWTYAVPNFGGDGTTKVLIFDEDGKEFADYRKSHELEFLSSVQGTFNIYCDDCSFDTPDEDIVTTLTGRYGVYRGQHKVVFVKWKY